MFRSQNTARLLEFNKRFVHSRIFETEIYHQVKRLFEDRQSGDYDYGFSLEASEASRDIDDAEAFLRRVESYLHELISRRGKTR